MLLKSLADETLITPGNAGLARRPVFLRQALARRKNENTEDGSLFRVSRDDVPQRLGDRSRHWRRRPCTLLSAGIHSGSFIVVSLAGRDGCIGIRGVRI